MDQFWFNKISILLCEGPKPNISMISGFCEPLEPRIYGFYHAKILQNISAKYMEPFQKILILHIRTSFFVKFGKDMKRRAPRNPEDPLMKSPKSWIWGQYLFKSMNGFLLIWYKYLYQNIKCHF